jgi:hypothetical protein
MCRLGWGFIFIMRLSIAFAAVLAVASAVFQPQSVTPSSITPYRNASNVSCS